MQTNRLTANPMKLENITLALWVNWTFRFYLFYHLLLFDHFQRHWYQSMSKELYTASTFHWCTPHSQKRINAKLKYTFEFVCNWPCYVHWKLAHLRSTHFPNIFINIHKFSEVFVTIIRSSPIQFSINIQLARNGTMSVYVFVSCVCMP